MPSKRSGLVVYVILYVFLAAFFSLLGGRVDLVSLTIPLAAIALIAVVVLLLTGDWR